MVRYPAHLVLQARRLALSKNLSFSDIGNILGIQNSTISTWCRDISESKFANLIKRNQRKRDVIIHSEESAVSSMEFNKNSAKLFSAIIYGCEGSKYPASNCVAFTNSDPELVRTFAFLLRKAFPLNEAKWRGRLQVHTNQNYYHLVKFWSKLLGIPIKQFGKPTITSPGGKKHRNNYLGTCTLKYYSYEIQLKLIGIFEAFMRKSEARGGCT